MKPNPVKKEQALKIVRALVDKGHQALWAGGCVRDQILGIDPEDYDVATSARPEEVRKIFPRTVAVGQAFGVIEVIGPRQGDGKPILTQVATFRADLSYSDGRHPDAVRFCDPREDALRRDFTINGMFFDPLKNEVIDYVGGQEDLKNQLLRAIGNPQERIQEDALRMLRGARLAARFNLRMDPPTQAAILHRASTLTRVSPERIAEELRKILSHPSRAIGFRLLIDCGLACAVFPRLDKALGDWESKLQLLCELAKDASFPLSFAALATGQTTDEIESLVRELRLSNQEAKLIADLVEKAESLFEPEKMRLCELKKTLALPWIADLLELTRVQLQGNGRSLQPVDYCQACLANWPQSKLAPPPLVTGYDLEDLGLVPGPLFKRILDEIRDLQLDEALSTRDEALSKARQVGTVKSE